MEQLKDFLAFIRRLFIDIKYKFRGIKNIFIWIPTLIEDRHWDHVFILMILKKKLELTEKYIRKHGHHVGAGKDADNIKIAINLLDRLIKDNYMDQAFVPHKKKYGESHMNFEGNKLIIIHDNEPKNEKEKNQERELFKRCCTREDYLRHQDLEFLFNHLKKHILSWWD
jgi:hypothetical protein